MFFCKHSHAFGARKFRTPSAARNNRGEFPLAMKQPTAKNKNQHWKKYIRQV